MIRFLLACLLLASTTSAAETVMLISPDGVPLPNGNYRILVFSHDATIPPTSTVLPVGGFVTPPVIPPVVPPVPPVDTVTAKIDSLIAAVTDPTKAATANGLSEGYALLLGFIDNGMIADADNARAAAKISIDMGLRRVGKTAAWKPFTDGMETLTEPMDLPALVNCYTIAAARLKTSPVPPPIDPPSPVQKVTAVTYVYEKDQAAIPRPVSAALQTINADTPQIVATEFERDTVNGFDQIPEQYAIAREAAIKNGLPCLVVQAGDSIVRIVSDPQTEADVKEAIR